MSFGATAEILSTPDTEALGLVGRKGVIYGFTTPSHTGVNVIGHSVDDFALNVYFEDIDESYWFVEELVVKLDNGEGAVLSFDGSSTKFVKLDTGEWAERPKPNE